MIYEDDRIRTIEDLAKAADNHKAVSVPGSVWEKPKPAMVLMQLQGALIVKLMRKGIYIYHKKKGANL